MLMICNSNEKDMHKALRMHRLLSLYRQTKYSCKRRCKLQVYCLCM